MPSKLNASLLSVLLLAALLRCVPAAPFADSAGDTSGEEGGDATPGQPSSDPIRDPIRDLLSAAISQHKEQFEEEFPLQKSRYDTSLKDFKASSFAEFTSEAELRKEASLQYLAQGLVNYTLLLKHVEKEYPDSQILKMAKTLIYLMKCQMRNPDAAPTLTSIQEEQLLRDLDHPDAYNRKMTAHSILEHLLRFLVDGKRAMRHRESRRNKANRSTAPVTLPNC